MSAIYKAVVNQHIGNQFIPRMSEYEERMWCVDGHTHNVKLWNNN